MIPLFKPYVHPSAAEAVGRVLSYDADGNLYCGEGPLVKRFEAGFAALVGADPATVVAVNSCSSALALALQLCGVGTGDEVIATPMTCSATTGAIVNTGARIVWGDCHPLTGNLDPADVARKMTTRTKAIVAVDWAGTAAPHAPLRDLGVPVIEDAAHALLTGYWGASVAVTGGDYVTYSLGAIKHLCAGDGGMLVTHRKDVERAKKLRWHGLSRDSKADFRCEQDITEAGHRWHMNDINAAIGLANLPHAEWVVARSRLNAEFYHRALAGLPGVTLPPFDPDSSYWLMGILVDDRDGLAARLTGQGIGNSRAHRRNDEHPAFRAVSSGWPLPGVDYFDSHQLNIPNGFWVTEEEREHIAGHITDWALRRSEVAA
jgi:perosamine synthetase